MEAYLPSAAALARVGQAASTYRALDEIGVPRAAYKVARTAYQGGKRKVFELYNTIKTAGTQTKRGGPRRTVSSSSGTKAAAGYAGPIGRRRRVNPKTRKRVVKRKRVYKKRAIRSRIRGENYYAKNGCIATKEIVGTITDPDCVYLGHSSLVPDECLRTLVYAIVRRLYKQAIGYEADNMKSVIPYKTTSSGAQESNGHSVIVKYANNLTLNTKNQDVITVSGTTETIVSVGDMILTQFRNVSTASDGWKNARLLWIAIIDDVTGHTRAHMDLSTMKVDLYSKSELKMQNVTIPDTSSVTEDNVNNVPLVGRYYHMSQWAPKTSDDDNNYLDAGIQDTGMITWRANQTWGQQFETWKEPPPSKAFTNCTASSLVRMEPGTVRQHTSVTRKVMRLEDFLIALAYNSSNVANKNCRIGTHDMFAMERLLSRYGELPIKLVYECNFFTAVSVSSSHKAAIMQRMTFGEQNSLP